MGSIDEQILRASKEIMVKFIETGRVSPTAFAEHFQMIYNTIDETVRGRRSEDMAGPEKSVKSEKSEKGKS